jgi:hypothetical protein
MNRFFAERNPMFTSAERASMGAASKKFSITKDGESSMDNIGFNDDNTLSICASEKR